MQVIERASSSNRQNNCQLATHEFHEMRFIDALKLLFLIMLMNSFSVFNKDEQLLQHGFPL